MKAAFLLMLSLLCAAAEEMTIRVTPGCFSTQRRCEVRADTESGTHITYKDDKKPASGKVANPEEVKKVLQAIRELTFTKNEESIYKRINSKLGPSCNEIVFTLDGEPRVFTYSHGGIDYLLYFKLEKDKGRPMEGTEEDARALANKIKLLSKMIDALLVEKE